VTSLERGHRWFAALWDIQTRLESEKIRGVRRDVVAGATGRVLEIGCGTGTNFRYYGQAAVDVIATDPDPFMLRRATKRAAESDKRIEVQQVSAEILPFRDVSFDSVVSTANMCTIPDQARALLEIWRVLKPGGEYRFLDHVRYRNRFGALWQDALTPVWKWVGAGCHPNRDTGRAIEEAGFTFRSLERLTLVPPLPPMIIVRPAIKGVAIRP